MPEGIEDVHPLLVEARACVTRGEFEHGIEIYSDILQGMEQNDWRIPHLYLEYANALVRNSGMFFPEGRARGSDEQNIRGDGQDVIEDDLEIAWNLLEVSSRKFMELEDYSSLATAQFLLGEVCILNNGFQEALYELIECVRTMDKIYEPEDIKYVEVYASFANCYEFLEDFGTSKEYCMKAITIHEINQEREGSKNEMEKADGIIKELSERILLLEYKMGDKVRYVEDESEVGKAVININAFRHNKK